MFFKTQPSYDLTTNQFGNAENVEVAFVAIPCQIAAQMGKMLSEKLQVIAPTNDVSRN